MLNQGTVLQHQQEFNDRYGKTSGFNRYNFRSNIDIQATSRLKVQVDLAARMEKETGPSTGLDEILRFFAGLFLIRCQSTPPMVAWDTGVLYKCHIGRTFMVWLRELDIMKTQKVQCTEQYQQFMIWILFWMD